MYILHMYNVYTTFYAHIDIGIGISSVGRKTSLLMQAWTRGLEARCLKRVWIDSTIETRGFNHQNPYTLGI